MSEFSGSDFQKLLIPKPPKNEGKNKKKKRQIKNCFVRKVMNYLKGWYINHFSKTDLLLWDSDEDNSHNLYNKSMSTQRFLSPKRKLVKIRKIDFLPLPSLR